MATAVRFLLALLGAVAGGALIATAVAYARAIAYRRRHPPVCALLEDDERGPWPARALAGLATFVAEWAALVIVVLAAPFASWRSAGRRGPPAGERPVAFVSVHRAAAFALARRLRRDGRSDIRPIGVGLFGGDVDAHAARLGATLDAIVVEAAGRDVDVIAHGVAGLIVRAHVRARGRASGVARLVTLGAPHQGTTASRQFAADAPEIARLASGDPVPALVDCTAIYSTDDAWVVPASAGYWAGAFNIEVRGVGHTALLFSRRVYDLVRENLEAPGAGRAADATPR